MSTPNTPQTPAQDYPAQSSSILMNEKFSRRFFLGVFFLSVFIMVISAIDFPTNGDELFHIANGKANMKFYTTLGKDTSYINPPAIWKDGKDLHLMHYYGVFTDITGESFANVLTAFKMHYMDGRHIWNVLLAMLGVLFTALCARLFAKSWWAATLAVFLMMATPMFTGFTYNLTKDIPLATGFIISLYAIYQLFLGFDKPLNKRDLVLLAIGIMIAIGNRVAGLMIFGYAGIFGIWAIYRHRKDMTMKDIRNKTIWIAGTLVVGYFAALLFWPFGLVSPISHVIETFEIVSKYPLQMATLFDGENMDINNAFWYFLPKYMLITFPVLMLIGLAIFLVLLFVKKFREQGIVTIFILLAFPSVFPVLYIIYKKAVVYQNWRHVFFVFPTLVVLASLGWFYLLQQRKRLMIGLPIFILLFAKPVWWMIRNHPYEYTYYNELVGGTSGAYTKYEMDSYCFGIKECMKWIADHNDIKKDTLVIACNDDYPPIYYAHEYIKQPVKNVMGGFRTRNSKDWDYGIFNTLFLSKEEMDKFFPPQSQELVYTVLIDKVVPGYIILKRIDKTDIAGINAFEHGNSALADTILSAYNRHLKYTSNTTTTVELMAKLNTRHFPEAVALYNLLQSKNMTTAEIDYYGAAALANTGQLQKARDILQGVVENGQLIDPRSEQQAQQMLQQLNQALRGSGGGARPGL